MLIQVLGVRKFLVIGLAVTIGILSFEIEPAAGASLTLSWSDNSSDETGFHIERKLGLNGTYASIATASANVTSYTDSSLADNSTYCFRVNAFNSAGNSPYTPEVCGTTPAAPANSYNLTVTVMGSGAVTSNPSGIVCSSVCTKGFTSAD